MDQSKSDKPSPFSFGQTTPPPTQSKTEKSQPPFGQPSFDQSKTDKSATKEKLFGAEIDTKKEVKQEKSSTEIPSVWVSKDDNTNCFHKTKCCDGKFSHNEKNWHQVPLTPDLQRLKKPCINCKAAELIKQQAQKLPSKQISIASELEQHKKKMNSIFQEVSYFSKQNSPLNKYDIQILEKERNITEAMKTLHNISKPDVHARINHLSQRLDTLRKVSNKQKGNLIEGKTILLKKKQAHHFHLKKLLANAITQGDWCKINKTQITKCSLI